MGGYPIPGLMVGGGLPHPRSDGGRVLGVPQPGLDGGGYLGYPPHHD